MVSSSSGNGILSRQAQKQVTAHEMGHNFNAEHDCQDDSYSCVNWMAAFSTIEGECLDDDDHFLMFPSVSGGSNSLAFSQCSKYNIEQAILAQGSCFVPTPDHFEIDAPVTLAPTPAPSLAPSVAMREHRYNDTMSSFVGEFDFRLDATPQTTSISPDSGNGSTLVTITGTLLDNVLAVYIGQLPCTEPVSTATEVTCTAPGMPAGNYHIKVITELGTAAHPFGHANEVVFSSVLEFHSLSPRVGSMAGGMTATITGQGFSANKNQLQVDIGIASAVIVSSTATDIVFVVPAQPFGLTEEQDTETYSVMVTVFPDQSSHRGFYGEISPSTHHYGKPIIPTNCLQCSTPFVVGESALDPATHDTVTPDRYFTMTSSCSHPLSCRYTYDWSKTPLVHGVSPAEISPAATSVGTRLSISGNFLGQTADDISVEIGAGDCVVDGATATDTYFECVLGQVPAGEHDVYVDVAGFGTADTNTTLTSTAGIAAVNVSSSSFGGGDVIEISGFGFGLEAWGEPSEHFPAGHLTTEVTVCNASCEIVSVAYGTIVCQGPAVHTEASILRYGNAEPLQLLASAGDLTTFSDRGPAWGQRAFDVLHATEYISSASGDCWVGADAGTGHSLVVSTLRFFPAALIRTSQYTQAPGSRGMDDDVFEVSNDMSSWTIVANITGAHQGWNDIELDTAVSGRYVRYRGTGLSVCAVASLDFIGVRVAASTDANSVECPLSVATRATRHHPSRGLRGRQLPARAKAFDVSGMVLAYTTAVTPTITGISPPFGSSLGNTLVTISGTDLPSSGALVQVNGVECDIVSATSTAIECLTGRRVFTRARGILVQHPAGMGGSAAVPHALRYSYLDRWSRLDTWLNFEPPVAGDSVIVPLDQTIIMDVSPPPLYLVHIMGAFVFDRADLELQAHFILVQGGKLEIGTEAQPFEQQATITLLGGQDDLALPGGIGNKVLATLEGPLEFPAPSSRQREWSPTTGVGFLDMHGTPRATSWTKLAESALGGSKVLRTATPTDFAPGDAIVIGSPFEQATVDRVEGNYIYLTSGLKWTHRSDVLGMDDESIDIRAAVGLLTHNVRVRGNMTDSNSDTLFGGHTFAKGNVVQRIENAEVSYCGQAPGKRGHCLHLSDLPEALSPLSYVKSSSIHHGFYRAISLTKTFHTTISNNVGYWVEGHMFAGDDKSEFNTVAGNLGINDLATLGCGRSDCKPNTFSIFHPNNFYRSNHAIDGMAQAFGFSMKCGSESRKFPVAELFNNTGGRHGGYGITSGCQYSPESASCKDLAITRFGLDPHVITRSC